MVKKSLSVIVLICFFVVVILFPVYAENNKKLRTIYKAPNQKVDFKIIEKTFLKNEKKGKKKTKMSDKNELPNQLTEKQTKLTTKEGYNICIPDSFESEKNFGRNPSQDAELFLNSIKFHRVFKKVTKYGTIYPNQEVIALVTLLDDNNKSLINQSLKIRFSSVGKQTKLIGPNEKGEYNISFNSISDVPFLATAKNQNLRYKIYFNNNKITEIKDKIEVFPKPLLTPLLGESIPRIVFFLKTHNEEPFKKNVFVPSDVLIPVNFAETEDTKHNKYSARIEYLKNQYDSRIFEGDTILLKITPQINKLDIKHSRCKIIILSQENKYHLLEEKHLPNGTFVYKIWVASDDNFLFSFKVIYPDGTQKHIATKLNILSSPDRLTIPLADSGIALINLGGALSSIAFISGAHLTVNDLPMYLSSLYSLGIGIFALSTPSNLINRALNSKIDHSMISEDGCDLIAIGGVVQNNSYFDIALNGYNGPIQLGIGRKLE